MGSKKVDLILSLIDACLGECGADLPPDYRPPKRATTPPEQEVVSP